MKRTPIRPELSEFPAEFHPWLTGARLYDSSCSARARVVFIDREEGWFLKSADPGTLKKEAELTRYFHAKGLAPKVEGYVSAQRDWLLTKRIPGEDCTEAMYLREPKKLCEKLAEILSELHAASFEGCPVADRTAESLAAAEKNYRAGQFDPSYLPESLRGMTPDAAWEKVVREKKLLRTDTLLHGDYCLPNVMLENWRFSGLIDLCHAGVGDRHIDIYWAIWSLNYNIREEKLADRFMDVYGREKIDPAALELIAAMECFG